MHNSRRRLSRSVSAAFLIACSLIPVATEISFAQNAPTLGDVDSQDLSPLVERKLGEQIMNFVRRDPSYLDDAPAAEYMNRLGNSLLDAHADARGEAKFAFDFFVVRDSEINAFALPGGFIGTHTGLILMAQSESELASVLGHEIGHVSQRHIARMLGSQRLDSLIPIAGLILAVLAARNSPDAAIALATSGQGIAIQRQLAFSRDAEREADRVGFQILRDGGYDTSAMAAFFGRLQASQRNFSDNVPAFLRSHPLTSERIADIQTRTLAERYKQRADSLDFLLAKARVRVLQHSSPQGLMTSKAHFESELKAHDGNSLTISPLQAAPLLAAQYGIAFSNFQQKDFVKAQAALNQITQLLQRNPSLATESAHSSFIPSLQIDLAMASKTAADAVQIADQARQQLPLSQGIAHQYADALLAAKRFADAERFLREQAQLYRSDPSWFLQLARMYEAQGKLGAHHLALAQAYVLNDSYRAALQQVDFARKEKDLQYHDLAVMDAIEREWLEKREEEMKEEKRGGR
jgi:beta-barrel assembly-enhancing protease